MAQTKQAREKETNETRQPQGLSRSGGQQNRGLARRDQFSPSSPFSLLDSFRSEMERLFDDFGFGRSLGFPGFGGFAGQTFDWSPQTEVFERGNQLVIQADLPGMSRDDINVDIEDDRVILRGDRRSEHTEDKEGIYRSERSYGSFYRSIPLPQGIDSEQANANFRDGVLEITMPLPEKKSRGRRIEIGEGGEQHRGRGQTAKTGG